jgi:hypothetical protein
MPPARSPHRSEVHVAVVDAASHVDPVPTVAPLADAKLSDAVSAYLAATTKEGT